MTKKDLNARIGEILGRGRTEDYCGNVGQALDAAAAFDSLGYSFRLKDKKPKQLHENLWEARVVTPAGDEVVVSDEEAGLALCLALVKAHDAMSGSVQ